MITNSNNNNKTRGRTLAGPTLQDLVRRSHTGDLNPYALNATITTMVHVLPNATSTTELAIWLLTVGVPPMPTLLTTKGALGQANVYAVGRAGTNPDSNVVTVTLSIGAFQMKSCRAPLKELSDKGIIRLSSSRLGELRSGFQEEGKWDHFECALDYRELNKLLVKDLIPPKESRFSLTSTRDPVFIYLR
ncbi:hypothetical protein Tco_1466190 [Tanacetum coccineum]